MERVRYDAFGKPVFINEDTGAETASSQFGNPYAFQGRRWDSETGLYHFRLRAYDPATGTFLQKDPIGIWGDMVNRGNGYTFEGNGPWDGLDPLGLEDCSVQEVLSNNYFGPGFYQRVASNVNADPTGGELHNLLNLGEDEKWRKYEALEGYNAAISAANITGQTLEVVTVGVLTEVASAGASPILEVAGITLLGTFLSKINKSAKITRFSDKLFDYWKGYKRRSQSEGDADFSTQRAALREAFRRFGVKTSEANNFKVREVYGNNPNLNGPQGEPYYIIEALNLDGELIEIQFHVYGHKFPDGTFEFPHFQGPAGEHICIVNP